ncbi:MAG: chaplin [Corynebacteriales bacterium]|nr:chaplin [Mycobacteriales bacterium]
MNVWIRRTVQVGIVAAGLLVASATGAAADGSLETSDNYGIANGAQVVAPIQVPINVCGNAVGVLGDAEAGCKGGSEATIKSGGHDLELESEDNYGIANGIQAVIPVQVPVDVCGNAVAVAGDAEAGCKGGSEATLKRAAHGSPELELESEDNYGIANGIQAVIPVQGPVDVCGNAVAVAGDAEAGCKGGSEATLKRAGHKSPELELETEDNYGIANGIQGVIPVQVPVNVCGNAVGVLGDAEAGCKGGSEAHLHHGKAPELELESEDNYGIANGIQVVAPIQVPVDVSGNAVAVAGDAEAESKGGSEAHLG